MQFTRPLVLISLLLLVLPAASAVSAQELCEGYTRISRLGGNNAFTEPIRDREALEQLFEDKRGGELEGMLREIGWEGDPNDLFRAVSEGRATRQSIEPGTPLGWMVFRRGGSPSIRKDLCWAGSEAFGAWEIQFTSKGVWYSAVVPEDCGNLALVAQTPEPQCSLNVTDSAGSSCESTTFQIDATGSSGEVTVEVTPPSGPKATLTAADAQRPLRWSYDSSVRKGTFEFVATSRVTTPRQTTIMCTAEATVNRQCKDPEPPPPPPAPTCSVDLPSEPVLVGDEFTASVRATAGEGTSIAGVTLDGSQLVSPYSATLTADAEGPRTVRAVVTDAEGQTGRCEGTIDIQPKPARGWSVTPFLTRIDTSSTQNRFDLGGGERQAFWFEGGEGAGAMAEYHFNKRLGLGFGAFFGELENHWELDFVQNGTDVWAMTDDDIDTFGLFVGPVFHLTPDSRVDLFIGPLLGYLDWGSAEFELLDRRLRRSYDNETTFGAQLGLDIPFKADGPWSLYLGAMYFDGSAESDEVPEIDIDLSPFFLNLGVTYDFF